MSPPVNKYLGVSAKQLEILKFRDAKRLELRELYLRDAHHPTKHQLFDEGLQKFGELRLSASDRFKPTIRNFGAPFILFGTMFFVYSIVHKSRSDIEHRIRTGQVSYADRVGKNK